MDSDLYLRGVEVLVAFGWQFLRLAKRPPHWVSESQANRPLLLKGPQLSRERDGPRPGPSPYSEGSSLRGIRHGGGVEVGGACS